MQEGITEELFMEEGQNLYYEALLAAIDEVIADRAYAADREALLEVKMLLESGAEIETVSKAFEGAVSEVAEEALEEKVNEKIEAELEKQQKRNFEAEKEINKEKERDRLQEQKKDKEEKVNKGKEKDKGKENEPMSREKKIGLDKSYLAQISSKCEAEKPEVVNDMKKSLSDSIKNMPPDLPQQGRGIAK